MLKDIQIDLEKEAIGIKQSKVMADLTKAITQGRFDETNYGNALLRTYFPPYRNKIQEYFDTKYSNHTGKTQNYLRYLTDNVDQIAYIVLQTVIKQLSLHHNKVKVLALSKAIIHKLSIIQTYDTAEKMSPKLISYLGSEYRRASARRKQLLFDKHLDKFKDIDGMSDNAEAVKAGAILIDLLLHSGTGMIEKVKLWDKTKAKHPSLHIRFTEDVMEALSSMYYIPDTSALFPPMVCEPIDWTGFTEGGYLTVKYPFIKLRSKEARKRIKNMNLSKPMRAINKLQKVGWRVNKRVYDVIQYIYTNNLIDPRSPPTLPRLYGEVPTSNPPDIRELMEWKEYDENADAEAKKSWAIWNKKREKVQIDLDAEHGRRLQYLMTMGVATKMLSFDKFYYVYQLDYRGRVYPITDFFNPQSKGYVKSMLEFSEGHYLTQDGIRWLYIHSANTYGLDKEPLDDRVQWTRDNEMAMYEAGKDPLGNLSTWTDADSPYEFLAACMALYDHMEGNKVHLPIQLDAVNSGIQMYSGLLRDKTGAESTCVIGNVRSDLYQEVANKVEHKLLNKQYPPIISFMDKEGKETTLSTRIEAESLIGNFTRSMTKHNVMTVPYSVSMRGMTLQNWDVMEKYKLQGKVFWKGDEWVVNKLWTELTHESIYDIVQGARAGQEYLKEVTKLHTEPILWHTPIYDLPVFQAFYKTKETRVLTILGRLSVYENTEDTNKAKQLSSVAANYIHSIDSTILLHVIDNIGKDIGTIHDCFLVHPNDGTRVVNGYKHAYVEVMESDPLKKFQEELDPEGTVDIPYVGDLNLKEVYDSMYIIS